MGTAPELLASVGVGDRDGKEADRRDDEEQIAHGLPPMRHWKDSLLASAHEK